MVRVAGLYRVGLGVPDLDGVAAFYEKTWAMRPVRGNAAERVLRSRGTPHGDLALIRQEAASLHHLALGVRSEADLRALLAAVEGAGHPIAQPAQRGERPDEAVKAVIHDLDGNRIELVVPADDPAAADDAAGSARHLGHIVLWTPAERIAQQEAFYALLGFQVSDRTHIGMSFLRCNTDHHSIALAKNNSGRTGLQHVAFDIGSVDDVMREFARLRDEGVKCIWGVGRHGPGNNVFSYYRDPAGNVIEYYGDMEVVEEAETVEPRIWGPQHKGDIWGVAGAPPQAFRD